MLASARGEHTGVQVQGNLSRRTPASEADTTTCADYPTRQTGRRTRADADGLIGGRLARKSGLANKQHRRRGEAGGPFGSVVGHASLKLLLDSHIWLWSLARPARLSRRVRSALTRAGSELWLSPVSVWEVLVLAERGGRVKLDDD